jgi:uncharacterized protein
MLHADRMLLRECHRGHLARVERLVAEGADGNCRGKYGWTPLHHAAGQGHVDVVRFLLAAGARATLRTDDGAPTMFFACVQGHAEVVELLLAAGGDPNAHRASGGPTRDGDTPGVSLLHVAIQRRHARIVAALLQAGAYTDFVAHGQDALAAAREVGDAEIVALLQHRIAGRATARRRR